MSDFDDFLRESEAGEQEDQDVRQPFEPGVTSDEKQYVSLVDQLKGACHYSGTDADNHVLLLVCEEYVGILNRELDILRKQIQELKDIKRSQVEKEAAPDSSKEVREIRANAVIDKLRDQDQGEVVESHVVTHTIDTRALEESLGRPVSQEELEEAAVKVLENFGPPSTEELDKVLREDID